MYAELRLLTDVQIKMMYKPKIQKKNEFINQIYDFIILKM